MSLVLRYRFDEPTATLTTDSSGNSNTLVNGGGVVSFNDPTYGNVAYFDGGATSQLNLSSPPAAMTGTSSRTYSYWINRTNDSVEIVHGQSATESDGYRMQFHRGNTLRTTAMGVIANTYNVFTIGQWFHVVIVLDGSSEVVYVDGVVKGTHARTYNTGTGPLMIGGTYVFSPSNHYFGYMSDFRVYDTALSATDVSSLFSGGPNPTVVTWVLDGDSKYEVSSKEHLLQLMNGGTLYANAGSTPSNFLTSDYIQTVDIDLEGDSTNVKPIGAASQFSGEYDGNGFTVSNWSYVDPNFNTGASASNVGLFAKINLGGVVKNVRLAGVCTVSGFEDRTGFVVGELSNGTVSNVEVDLSPGSHMTQGDIPTGSWCYMGGVIGWMASQNSSASVLTLRGQMDNMIPSANVSRPHMGGLVGDMSTDCTGTMFRNLCAFPNGLNSPFYAGGIVGHMQSCSLTKALNAMVGDVTINGVANAGGITGSFSQTKSTHEHSELVNSMRGEVISFGGGYAAGITGSLSQFAGNTIHSLMNYMTGDVKCTDLASRSAGMMAYAYSEDLTTSINAMNGKVHHAIVAISQSATNAVSIDTTYGLDFDASANSTTSPVTGLPTDPETGLPIVDLTGVDVDGVSHTFDFILGNVPRKFNQLQINLSTGLDLQLAELEVYDMNGANLSLLGTASSTVEVGNSPASNAIDGDTNNLFDADPAVNSVAIAQPIGGIANFTLDLDREYTLSELNKVVYYNRGESNQVDTSVGGVVTLHSSDGVAPQELGTLTNELIQEFEITRLPFGFTDPGFIAAGAIMYVNAGISDSYVDGDSVMNNLVTGDSTVFDFDRDPPPLTGGDVDFTPSNNSLKLSSALSVQTISLWFKKVDFNGVTFIDLREWNGTVIGEAGQMENGNAIGAFFTGGSVYLNGNPSTYADVDNSPNDAFINVVVVGAYPSAATRLTLFANFGGQGTYPTTFRSALFYDRALSAAEVLANYNTALSSPQAGFALVLPLTVTPRAVSVLAVVGPQDGATAYRLTTQSTGSSTERTVKDGFTGLEQTIANLTPQTEYTIRLYSTSGAEYSLVDESTVSTLENSASSYDVMDFGDNGQFDLSALDTTSVALVSDIMNELFTTGDEIELSVSGARGTKKSKFVNRGSSVSITGSEALVAPFSTDAGPGQAVSLTLSDSSTVAVSYDETTEAVTVGATSYVPGDSFILDGKKTTIVDI